MKDTKKLSWYQERINEILAKKGYIGQYNPAHIEAWMRLEAGTLDWMSKKRFEQEVEIARQCVDADGAEGSEKLAFSMGCV